KADLSALHREINLDLVAVARANRLTQIVEREEQEALGKREVLLQQPIALIGAPGYRQQRLAVLEPRLANGLRRVEMNRAALLGAADIDADTVRRDLFEDPMSNIRSRLDEKAQRVERQRLDIDARRRLQPQTNRRPDLAVGRDALSGELA